MAIPIDVEGDSDLENLTSLIQGSKGSDVTADLIDDTNENRAKLDGVVGLIWSNFNIAESGRLDDEHRWLRARRNIRKEHNDRPQIRTRDKSRISVKMTKVKVQAAYGQMIDILFGNGQFPIVIEPTPVPEGISDVVHLNVNKEPNDEDIETNDPVGFKGDGREVPAGALEASPLGPSLGKELEGLDFVEGRAKLGEPELSPAKIAAKQMEKVIKDQLLDTRAISEIRKSCFECASLGSGVVKGPFNFAKTIHKWVPGEDGGKRTYKPEQVQVPRLEYRSLWNIYPDPNAITADDMEWLIDRHRMSREQLRQLRKLPFFDEKAIDSCLEQNTQYVEKHWENTIYNNQVNHNVAGNDPVNRFEVLEYWGIVDKRFLELAGISVDEGLTNLDSVQANVWICGREILRFVLNPFTPARIPYHIFPYENDPYRIFGVGISENMEDAQMIMDGSMRMAIDNLAIAGNVILEVDSNAYEAGQSMEFFEGKIFYRKAGAQGKGLSSVQVQNTAPANLQMYDKAAQLADLETGIPSVVHGQTGVSGTGRTASGLSMILGGAGLATKTVIKNVDDFLLKPLGDAYFWWNMQFNEENIEIIGDLDIKAKATASLLQREVRSQRLTTILQVATNPILAPFFKLHNLAKEVALLNDMDPDDIVNNPEEAAIWAERLKGLQNAMGVNEEGNAPSEQQGGVVGSEGASAGANPGDPSNVGGGTLGVGATQAPGTPGFTGGTP